MYCKNCGKPLTNEAKFCPNCGFRNDNQFQVNQYDNIHQNNNGYQNNNTKKLDSYSSPTKLILIIIGMLVIGILTWLIDKVLYNWVTGK